LLANFVIATAALLGLYVFLDMVINMDEFTEHGHSIGRVLANMVSYYAPNLLLYFKQLAGAIVAFSCLATVARMRRQNEMTAMLASGVSLHRLAIPVIGFGVVATGLLVIDTEWLIPRVAHKLARDHDDVDGHNAYKILFLPDRDGALLSAGRFDPSHHHLDRLLVIWRDESGSLVQTLEADRATWESSLTDEAIGRWRLERARKHTRVIRDDRGFGPRETDSITFPTYYESDLSPKVIQLRQTEGWHDFLSLRQLGQLVPRDDAQRQAILHVKHTRVTAPMIGLILLLLGLPFFLDRAPTSVLTESGKCLLVCGLCYVLTFVAQSIRPETNSAFLAWLPIFVFATVAMVMVERIRT
jgi:lipopolysaccharide export system permease protein